MIIVETQGGLGNQLFQAGLALEIQERTGQTVYLDTWRHGIRGGRPFELPHDSLGLRLWLSEPRLLLCDGIVGRLARGLRRIMNSKSMVEQSQCFDPRFLDPRDGTTLFGYFQSWRYSTSSIESIKESMGELRRTSKWVSINQSNLNESGLWFGIHIRRGDYLGALGKGVFGMPTMDYYRKAIAQVQSDYPTARGVVFTDDLENALRDYPELFSEVEAFSPTDQGSSLDNLLLMGAGVGLVCANSTFSWWAARLSPNTNGVFTVPSNWFVNPEETPDDLVPEGWVKF